MAKPITHDKPFCETFKGVLKTITPWIAARIVLVSLIGSAGAIAFTAALAFIGVSLIAAGNESNPFGSSQVVDVIGSVFGRFGLEFTTFTSIIASLTMFLVSVVLSFAGLALGFTYARDGVRLRDFALNKILRSNWLFIGNRSSGDLSQTWNNASAVHGFYGGLTGFGSIFIELGVYITSSFVLSWQITVFLLGIQIVAFLSTRIFLVYIKRRDVIALVLGRRKGSVQVQVLTATKLIKVNNMVRRITRDHLKLDWKLLNLGIANNKLNFSKGVIYHLLGFGILLGGVALSLYGLGVRPDLVLLYIILVQRLNGQLGAFEGHISGFIRSFPTLAYWLGEREEMDKHPEVSGDIQFANLRRGIRLENVHFSYRSELKDGMISTFKALDGVTVDVPQGKVVALVGPSGAGKTTTLDVIVGLLSPDSGRVLLDGKPLAEYDIESWRNRLGYITQEALLFGGTIGDNVRFFDPEASDEKVKSALKAVALLDHVNTMPDGLESEIGERGGKISGGQRQRLALARIMLRGADVMILDEATNQIDIENETIVNKEIASRKYSSTVIIVTHRTHTVMSADIIYFVRDGKIAESGTPKSLLDKKGKFYDYWLRSTGQISDN